MTEREEAQQRHDQRKQRSLERRAPTLSHDDQILTFRQWCTLNAISERTGARICGSKRPGRNAAEHQTHRHPRPPQSPNGKTRGRAIHNRLRIARDIEGVPGTANASARHELGCGARCAQRPRTSCLHCALCRRPTEHIARIGRRVRRLASEGSRHRGACFQKG